jgi:uncharacterized membrane protein (DUF4010 family)
VVIAVLNASLVPSLAPPFVAMALVSGVIMLVLYRRSRSKLADGGDLKLHNPFELRSAITVGLVVTAILLVTRWANHLFGAHGYYGTAALAGIADVDGVVLSAATMHREGMDAEIATNAIAIAAMVNTISKVAIATWIGGRALGWRLLLSAIAVVSAGVIALVIA